MAVLLSQVILSSPKLAAFLGHDGINFFRDLYDTYNGVPLVVRTLEGIPHLIHFREGMQIRNFLRRLPECENWDDIEMDDNYLRVVCLAIDRPYKIAENVTPS